MRWSQPERTIHIFKVRWSAAPLRFHPCFLFFWGDDMVPIFKLSLPCVTKDYQIIRKRFSSDPCIYALWGNRLCLTALKKYLLKSYLNIRQNGNFVEGIFGLKGCLSLYLSFGLFRNRKLDRRRWSQRQLITEVTARVGGLFSTQNTLAGAEYLPGEGTRPQQVGIWSRFTEVHEWVRWVNSGWHTTVNLLDALLKEIDWWKERQHKAPLYLTPVSVQIL